MKLATTQSPSTGLQASLFGAEEPAYSPADVERGQDLRALRHAIGLLASEAAERLGLTAAEYALLELGGLRADMREAERMMRKAVKRG